MANRRELKGMQFGRLTVLGSTGKNQQGKYVWLCSCVCGNTKEILGGSLVNGRTQSCGCLHKEVISRGASLRFKNIAGKRVGRLTIISRSNGGYWNTRCDCGEEKRVFGQYLRDGATRSCGCLREDYRKSNMQRLEGQRFGRLTVIRRDILKRKNRPYWLCLCDCGAEAIIYGNSLTGGHTQSCGCLQKETCRLPTGVANRNKTLYQYKTSATSRGLVWELSSQEFDSTVTKDCYYCGKPPSNTATSSVSNGAFQYNGIDRKDNNQGYTPQNVVPCCWVCNWMKRYLSETEFLNHIEQVFHHRRAHAVQL